VRDVHRRVRYMSWVQKRLDVDEITLLDVDMGAHMYFSGWKIVDMAGLVDVPFARHSDYNKKFVGEYVFAERNPDFGHVHAGWARATKIPKHAEWKERYIEIPGYPIGKKKLHIGNHIRKDLFIETVKTTAPADSIRFDGGIRLVHLDLPSPRVAPGGELYVDIAWQAGFRKVGFRPYLWLDDGEGHRTVHALPPGYDWYEVKKWKPKEQVHGRHRLPIPSDLPLGTYDVGIALVDDDSGLSLVAVQDGSDLAESEHRFLRGDWTSPFQVEIVSPEAALSTAESTRDQALAEASAGSCEAVWPMWKDAQRHVLRRVAWAKDQDQGIRDAIARCHARRAADSADTLDSARDLIAARRWNHRLDEVADPAEALAVHYDGWGRAAHSDEDWETAYAHLSMAMALDPTRSWTRRLAEEARDKKLGITRPGQDKPAKPAKAPKPEVDGDA